MITIGGLNIEHADIKGKLCKKDVFPKDSFIKGGLKLLEPESDPKYKALFRTEDMEDTSGVAVVQDGFGVAVISSLTPYEYEKKLEDCIPLGYMYPVYVKSG